MCDPGLALGLAIGAAQTAGQLQTASKNRAMVKKQQQLEYASQEREELIQKDAANKDAYQARMEQDRAVSSVKTGGEGMMGATAGLQVAEQKRQGALSIANALDRRDNANANFLSAGKATQTATANSLAQNTVNPLTSFTNVASAGLSNYGAFK